ncbi:MAG TPA: bi-domain-containing oxidoreductase [Kiritimatiellia bacterium]|nr:bi-domain-containing oxidoreductase [Kiritimatiellia bacterium]HRZ12570.1 bi-domain-containing oxidoreductase [Kiritimatiellia bacterium]HSA17648.1 bi-domain-containing oxidoreductase [Kiritimatiellia bacterium]
MKQVLQDLTQAAVTVVEVPVPEAPSGFVLVRNAASIISAGTESAQLAAAQAGALQKVSERPELIGRAFRMLRDQGLSALMKKVGAKKTGYAPLGYSCAGVVERAGAGVDRFPPGAPVACAGVGYAVHAEYACVPQNLCAPVPEGVSLEAAAYTTLGAIAMQGVRQAAVALGEGVTVIGLGLVGLLTVQLLKAAGCRVAGVDPAENARKWGRTAGCDETADPAGAGQAVLRMTRGLGADAVIIAAAASGSEPVQLAGRLARSRGRVVMVGSTGMDIPRQLFFEKELSFCLSRSYGPGRYDPTYEEGGLDYPAEYVRFTEQRNMEAFLQLAQEGKIRPENLTTHRFAFADALRAYDALKNRAEERVGIVLQYPEAPAPRAPRVDRPAAPRAAPGALGVGFIGAGSYARAMLLPVVSRNGNARLRGVADQRVDASAAAARDFGFAFAAAGAAEVLGDADTQVVFITTRHDSHASLVLEGLKAGKQVWVEKPLALTVEELRAVAAAVRAGPEARLVVGFNRRFSPLTQFIRARLGEAGPVMIQCRVNAGPAPARHWTQDPKIGGGRLVGEGCHFFDLACCLAGGRPVSVVTRALKGDRADLLPTANFAALVSFDNGSVASLAYSAQGSPLLPKEHLEILAGPGVARLDDFRRAEWYGPARALREKLPQQDKGQAALVQAFLDSARRGGPPPISFEDLLYSSALTLAAQQSLESGREARVRDVLDAAQA